MQLLGKAILIKPDKPPKRTLKGIYVPATIKDKPEKGTIISCGNTCEMTKKGDRVIFPLRNASIIVIDNNEYYFCKEDDLIYIAGDDERI
jgi:co-chaperonin GroES (HSP10)